MTTDQIKELTTNYLKAKKLTNRQIDVFYHVISGKSNKEIGESLFVTEKAIKYHLTNIFKRLNAKNRYELAIIYKSLYNQLIKI